MGTVNKHRKAFLEKFQEQGISMLPAALPTEIIPAIEEFWSMALSQAGQNYSKLEDELNRKNEELESSLAEERRKNEELEKQLNQSRDDLQSVHRELTTAHEQLTELRTELRSKSSIIESLRMGKEQLHEQIRREREESNHRYDLALEDHASQRQGLLDAIEEMKQQHKADSEKQERMTDYWTIQVADARDAVSSARKELDEAKKAHQADLNIERTRVGVLNNKLEELQQKLESSHREQVRLSKEAADAVSKYHDACNQVRTLTHQVSELRRSAVRFRPLSPGP
jgi:chromosome segregation ATPase